MSLALILAIPGYLLLLYVVARLAERYTPLVVIGGLLGLIALARWVLG